MTALPETARVFRPYVVWDDKPASNWTHAYPVGNGRMGAMALGAFPKEKIFLNEETIWAGPPFPQMKDNAREIVDQARKLLFEDKLAEAQKLVEGKLLPARISPRSYQSLGALSLVHHSETKTDQ